MLSSDDEYVEESPDTLREDLDALLERGNEVRLKYKRELLSLKADLAPLMKSLHTKLERGVDLSTYQESLDQPSCASDEAFEDATEQLEDHDQVAPFVTKIQAQLCSALHHFEINKTQIQIAQKGNKRMIIHLHNEIDLLREKQRLKSEECKAEIEEHKAIYQIMEEMLERDALEQEEEITNLRLERGMDPVPNSQRKSYRKNRRMRPIQRLSGGLRNIGRRVSRTPIGRRVSQTNQNLKLQNLRDSNRWKGFMKAERAKEADTDKDNVSRGRFAIIRRFRRSQQLNNDSSSSLGSVERQGSGFFGRSSFEKSFEESSREVERNGSGRFRKLFGRRDSDRSPASTAPSTPQNEKAMSSFEGVVDDEVGRAYMLQI